MEQSDGSPGFAGDAPYRILGWDQVQALAQAEGVGMQREEGRITLALTTAGPA